MPLIGYTCNCGKKLSKFYRMSKEAPVSIECDCGQSFKKQLGTASNSSKITIDNGFMAKSVEVDLEVVKSNEENSTKDFRIKE